MRTSSVVVWLVLALAVVAFFVARLSRSLGAIGLIVTIAALLVVVILARELLGRFGRPTRLPDRRPAPKDVTPREAALTAGPTDPNPTPGPTVGARSPTVVVVERADPREALAAKLAALDRLRADGLVTDAEYEAKRGSLIADF